MSTWRKISGMIKEKVSRKRSLEQKRVAEAMEAYVRLDSSHEFEINYGDLYLISSDYNKEAGLPSTHYFSQDIWGAQKIFNANPEEHYDIGSRLDGFIAHLLVCRKEVNYIDIRPLPYKIDGLNFVQGDATSLADIEDNSIESLSSFHAVEHFGLGRYGDSIDPDGWRKALSSFERVLKPGGHLYLGVPIESENRLVFNAHRIFNPMTIIEAFINMKLVDFAIIEGEEGCNYITVPLENISQVSDKLPKYSCGLFEFIKN